MKYLYFINFTGTHYPYYPQKNFEQKVTNVEIYDTLVPITDTKHLDVIKKDLEIKFKLTDVVINNISFLHTKED